MIDKNIKLVRIKIEFGSDFQTEVGMEILKLLLQAYTYSLESRHKKNKVRITINNEQLL